MCWWEKKREKMTCNTLHSTHIVSNRNAQANTIVCHELNCVKSRDFFFSCSLFVHFYISIAFLPEENFYCVLGIEYTTFVYVLWSLNFVFEFFSVFLFSRLRSFALLLHIRSIIVHCTVDGGLIHAHHVCESYQFTIYTDNRNRMEYRGIHIHIWQFTLPNWGKANERSDRNVDTKKQRNSITKVLIKK